jgi:hypothetical protein
LSSKYPNCAAFGCFIAGTVRIVFVLAPSRQGDHYSPRAEETMRLMARLVGNLPVELRAMFEAELSTIKRLDAQC